SASSGEAVYDAREFRSPLLFEYRERVVLGFAGVNDRREPYLAGKLQLPTKDGALNLSRRVVVVIVQPHLAPSDYSRMLRERLQPGFALVVVDSGVVRMDADRCENEIVALGKPDRRRMRVLFDLAVSHANKKLDSGLARATKNLFAIGVKVGHLDV